jgi:hypothetical protein
MKRVMTISRVAPLVGCIALALAPGRAVADDDPARNTSGAEWKAKCESSTPLDVAACRSYAWGVMQGLQEFHMVFYAVEERRPGHGHRIDPNILNVVCPKANVTTEQIVDAGRKFIADNKKDDWQSASYLLAFAFQQNFRCDELPEHPLPQSTPK